MGYTKTITHAFTKVGKRRELTGYLGQLRDGETLIHSMEYSTYSQAEQALDALAFDLLSDLAEQGLTDELPSFEPTTCVYCHKPHAPQHCPEKNALLFAPDTCQECAGAGIIAAPGCTGDQCGGWAETCQNCKGTGISVPVIHQRDLIWPPLDVDFVTYGPEV